ncbi:unnamed protein product [Symbiodinium natans]|uniref:14-3-3 domain-containing protein n=1 Tax=Symbiodinium natans TaxID=878477 RepID=A0A812Q8U1_9DINO|nr:unnamed protein product [Symbiodinium natans]
MTDHMRHVVEAGHELTPEEGQMLSVAYKNKVGMQRAAWRVIDSVMQKEREVGHVEEASYAAEYKKQAMFTGVRTCEEVLHMLEMDLLPHATHPETRVFYLKMRADYYRYIAEFHPENQECREKANWASQEAFAACQEGLLPTHPIRLGMALSQAAFHYDILGQPSLAVQMAKKAFDDALTDLDNVTEEHYKDVVLIMSVLRDNLALWTSQASRETIVQPAVSAPDFKAVSRSDHARASLMRLAISELSGAFQSFIVQALLAMVAEEDDAAEDTGAADGTDSTEVRALLTSAKAKEPVSSKRKVAPAPKLQMVRRQRRLLDPRTAAASRSAGLGAGSLQRRVEQLVDMALSVSTLEIFADRQPVEFGLTAVVELWLGPNQPLQAKAGKVPDDKSQFSLGKLAWMGGGAEPVTGGRWLAAASSAEATKVLPEWTLRVHTPTQGLRALKGALAKLAGGIKVEDIHVELFAAGSVAVTQPEHPHGEVACSFVLPALGDAPDELHQRLSRLDARAFPQQFAANMLDVGLDVDESHISILEPIRAEADVDPDSGAAMVRGSFKFAVRQQERYHDDFIIPVDLPDDIDDATPTDREIQQLFAEVDDLIHSQALAAALGRDNGPAVGERLDRATCALATALRADLANAMKESTEQSLKDALGRLQDVSLPEVMAARRQLCDLQLQRCVENKDIAELTMVLREAESLGTEEMSQYASAKRMLGQLRVRRLQEQSLDVLRSGAKDLESMVAVISVALRRDWEEVLNEGRTLAKAMIDDAKASGDFMKVAKIWRLADKEGLRVIAAHAAAAWEDQVATARRSDSATLLANLYRAAAVEGCDPLCKEALEALDARLKEIEEAWNKAGKKAYQKPLELLTKDFSSIGADDHQVKAAIKVATQRWKEREQMGKAEVLTVLFASENDPEAVLQCIQTTVRWDFVRVQSKAMAMFSTQVENAQRAGVEQGVATLAKMQQKAQECQVEQVTMPSKSRVKKDQPAIRDQINKALNTLVQTEIASQDPTRLLTFAISAARVGLAAPAAEARAEMRKILEDLQEKSSTDIIAQFKAAAESAGDSEAVALASDGLAAVEERERKERENEEAKLAAAAEQYIGDSVPATCVEVSVKAVQRGWKELEKRADDIYNARLEECTKAAAQPDPDEALLGYRDLLLALAKAQELNSPQKQPLRSSLEQLINDASSERDGVRLLDQYDWTADNPSFQEFIEKKVDAIMTAWQERGDEAAPKEPVKMAERAKKSGKSALETKILRLHSLDSALQAAKDSPSDVTKVISVYELIEKGESAEWMKKQVEKMTQRVLDEAKQSGDVAVLTALKGSAPAKVKKDAKDVLALVEKLSTLLDNRNWEGICELASAAQKSGCSGLAKEARNHLRGHVDEVSSTGVIVAETELLRLHKAALSAGLDDFAADLVERLGAAMPAEWAMEKGKSLAVRKDKIEDPILKARLQDMVNQTFNCWGGPSPPRCRRTRDRRNPLATSLKVEEVWHVANAENYLGYARRREEIRAAFAALDPAERAEDFNIKSQAVSLKGVSFHPEEPVDAGINEVWLWHGTGKEGAHGITETDFDMGRAGSAAGTMFGRGLYFAESCMKSDEYTKADDRSWSPLILCRVTCGRLFHCDWKRPSDHKEQLEEKCRSGDYHCVLGDREKVRGTYREFIVFDNDQVYPEYIVWYSRVEPFHDK